MRRLVVLALVACADSSSNASVAFAEANSRVAAAIDLARSQIAAAEREADRAAIAAAVSADGLVELSDAMVALHRRVDLAMHAASAAKTETELAAARARLDELIHAEDAVGQRRRLAAGDYDPVLPPEKLEMQKRIDEAKAAAMKAQRAKGVRVSKECLDNPLAKGCN